MPTNIYLNNAATTFPKPDSVLRAMTEMWRGRPSSPFRSSSFMAGKDIFSVCRENIGRLLGIADTAKIFFASGATDALNRIFGGLDLDGLPVVVTQTEHNSVLRPLYNNDVTAANVHVVPCDEQGRVTATAVERVLSALTPRRDKAFNGLFVLNHCSNVTGTVQDAASIGAVVGKYGMLYMLDVSQSAGCLPVDVDGWGVDVIAFTGHKSLFGPTGTGGYYVRRGIFLRPLMYGGTGRDSSRLTYDDGDYEYEVGTQSDVAFAGLNAGVEYVLGKGIENIARRELSMIRAIRRALAACSGVTVYGCDDDAQGPLVSFNIKGMNPSDTGYIMHNAYNITLRTGLHCSPLIHHAIGTAPHGTVRVSISDMTTPADAEAFVRAVKDICKG